MERVLTVKQTLRRYGPALDAFVVDSVKARLLGSTAPRLLPSAERLPADLPENRDGGFACLLSSRDALSSKDGVFVTSEQKRSARRLSYKDVMIAYLADGVTAVEQMLDSQTTSGVAVRKAFEALRRQNVVAATLDQLIHARLGSGRRGRRTPLIGEKRDYRAQQLKGGGPFINLPIESLRVSKGGRVEVRFEDGRIIVTNGPPPAKPDGTDESALAGSDGLQP